MGAFDVEFSRVFFPRWGNWGERYGELMVEVARCSLIMLGPDHWPSQRALSVWSVLHLVDGNFHLATEFVKYGMRRVRELVYLHMWVLCND